MKTIIETPLQRLVRLTIGKRYYAVVMLETGTMNDVLQGKIYGSKKDAQAEVQYLTRFNRTFTPREIVKFRSKKWLL